MVKLKELRHSDRRVITYIWGYIEDYGHAPTWEDIRSDLGYKSKSTVARVLNDMRARGLVDWVDGQSRTLKVSSNVVDTESLGSRGLPLDERPVISGINGPAPARFLLWDATEAPVDLEAEAYEAVRLYAKELRLRAERKHGAVKEEVNRISGELTDLIGFLSVKGLK